MRIPKSESPISLVTSYSTHLPPSGSSGSSGSCDVLSPALLSYQTHYQAAGRFAFAGDYPFLHDQVLIESGLVLENKTSSDAEDHVSLRHLFSFKQARQRLGEDGLDFTSEYNISSNIEDFGIT